MKEMAVRIKAATVLVAFSLAILSDRVAKFFVASRDYPWTCNADLAWSLPLPPGPFWIWWLGAMLVWLKVLQVEWRSGSLSDIASLALIGGGALSNLADRFIFGCVVDHINPGFWPAFNLADAAISSGILIYLAGRARTWYIGRVK